MGNDIRSSTSPKALAGSFPLPTLRAMCESPFEKDTLCIKLLPGA